MKVGDLVKLYGSPWLGIGVVTALYSKDTATVFFPNGKTNHPCELWRERLEVICK